MSSPRRHTAVPSVAAQKRVLKQVILHLPPDPRDVFLLHRMADLTYGQIGQRLNMESDTVQAHLADALLQIMRATQLAEV